MAKPTSVYCDCGNLYDITLKFCPNCDFVNRQYEAPVVKSNDSVINRDSNCFDDEHVIVRIDGVRYWNKDEPGINIGTFLGSFVLTSHRVLFLSSGGSGLLSMGSLIGGAVGGVALAGLSHAVSGKLKTGSLQISEESHNGEFQIELKDIVNCGVSRTLSFSAYFYIRYKNCNDSNSYKCFKTESGWTTGKWEEARSYLASVS